MRQKKKTSAVDVDDTDADHEREEAEEEHSCLQIEKKRYRILLGTTTDVKGRKKEQKRTPQR